ncbi:hypothetical protein PYCCODRAFT_1429071 [Trametes coccinea BRFM310]|uniref:Uncharacterized protein n=1 Tax=Trametes coccinea (strain BRFM310) TaxID=1353009 RepID=A0A1Y2I5U4_TRAC3|nr:hypothetical protein PYCCODRAFT_1429071 [Trametes coccinea BRFM310]
MSSPGNKLDKYNPWRDEAATQTVPSVNIPASMVNCSLLDVCWTTRGPSWETVFDYLPTIALVYAVHVGFRRVTPRRLPTLTSMRLWELYTGVAVAGTFENAANVYRAQARLDKDLSAIERVSRVAARVWQDPTQDGETLRVASQRLVQDWPGAASVFATIRAGDDDRPSLANKLTWWYNHIWSNETTWSSLAMFWLVMMTKNQDGHTNKISDHDFAILVTHTANMCRSKMSLEMPHDPNATEFYTELRDYLPASLGILALSVPFAMVARWTRLPWLYLPANALQRLIWMSTLYCGVMQRFQHYDCLNALHDKSALANALLAHEHDRSGMEDSTVKKQPEEPSN